MPNNTHISPDATKPPISPERMAQRLSDLRDWVLFELTLEEDERAFLGRIDAAVRSFLGEFRTRASQRQKAKAALQALAVAS